MTKGRLRTRLERLEQQALVISEEESRHFQYLLHDAPRGCTLLFLEWCYRGILNVGDQYDPLRRLALYVETGEDVPVMSEEMADNLRTHRLSLDGLETDEEKDQARAAALETLGEWEYAKMSDYFQYRDCHPSYALRRRRWNLDVLEYLKKKWELDIELPEPPWEEADLLNARPA